MSDQLDRIIDLTFELHRVFRQRMIGIAKEDEGANFAQIYAMLLIEKQPGLTMKELAHAMHITSPSATSFMNRLEKLKWVVRYHDPKNRRLVRLKMSPKGKKLIQSKMTKRRAEIRRMLGLLPAADQASLVRILQHLMRLLPSES